MLQREPIRMSSLQYIACFLMCSWRAKFMVKFATIQTQHPANRLCLTAHAASALVVGQTAQSTCIEIALPIPIA
jgi:hypothetical protein